MPSGCQSVIKLVYNKCKHANHRNGVKTGSVVIIRHLKPHRPGNGFNKGGIDCMTMPYRSVQGLEIHAIKG